ncbi:FecR family protein [Chitinophaga jiangningensis]|uniref:FecR family protein n=1 Tax=Chitinophaga jiangningensis TaxID=1419482 RepID=A0A1M7IT77_9BACT|nr:FecR domain-containing protein [Chitinophaga jiangningensis]SHM43930.1 FecR family protein [Chitinophaga jiangningensis]
MPVDHQIWLLVSLKLSGEATREELAQLELLMAQDPALKDELQVLTSIWKTRQAGLGINKEDAWLRHLNRLHSPATAPEVQVHPKRIKPWYWMTAAAVVFICFAGIKYFSNGKGYTFGKQTSHVYNTQPGQRMKLQLPDGTSVWLNVGSKLTYSGNFKGDKREVQLSGEAFFDVAPDKDRPFVIHTSTIDLRVLGTAFNIRSYEEEKETEAALVRGAVEVTLRNDPGKKIILKPKEKILVNSCRNDSAIYTLTGPKSTEESPLIVLSKIRYWGRDSSNNLESAWVKNKLMFDKENLENIAAKIERWYNVQVIITDNHLNDATYTGLFENEKLEEVLEALRLTGGFHYSIKGNTVTINR